MVIELSASSTRYAQITSYSFFQTYLPCINHSIDLFREYIDRLQNIISLYPERATVVIMGDINTHLSRSGHQDRPNNRSLYFNTLLRENNLVSINTLDLCRGADSTFVTYDGKLESLIDHIIIPIGKQPYVSSCEIKEDETLNVSRHRPVHCVLGIPASRFDFFDNQVASIKNNWKKLNQESISAYTHELENNELIHNRFLEGDLNSHSSIDRAYQTRVSEITVVARKCFLVKKFNRSLKPYWYQELGDFHKRMTLKRTAW